MNQLRLYTLGATAGMKIYRFPRNRIPSATLNVNAQAV